MKNIKEICIVISLLTIFISIDTNAERVVSLAEFDDVAKEVKQLKKTDLVLSLGLLTAYEDLLDTLSIEQSLLYFKLLTEIHIEMNKYSLAKNTANEGLVISKRLASPSILMSELLYLKGFAYENLGNIEQATKEYKTGLEVAESLHNKVQVASGLINLGAIAYLNDDYTRSLVLLNDAYNIAGQTNSDELKGKVNSELGIVYSHLQQEEQSMLYYQESYFHFKKAGLLLSAHTSLHNIAVMHIHNQDYQQAITVFATIINESNKDSPSDGMYNVYSGLAWAYLKQDESDPVAAYDYLVKAKTYVDLTEKIDYQLDYYYSQAHILEKLGKYYGALTSIAELEKIMAEQQRKPLIKRQNYVNILGLKASVYYQQGDFKRAYQEKSKEIALTDRLYENEDNSSIERVRLKLESEQADKQNKILYNQNILHDKSLTAAKEASKVQRIYLIISALLALAFAWLLVKLLQNQKRLTVASNIDSLTGVISRRSLMKKPSESFEYANAKKTSFSLLMLDVDHFKEINEEFGHKLGDQVLSQIALLSGTLIRRSDVFGRLGGEEFMICLPKTSFNSAMEISNKIHNAVSKYNWYSKGLKRVTLSIGVASKRNETDISQLMKRADEHLCQAKIAGHHKVWN